MHIGNTLTLGLRMLVLLGTALLAFFFSDRKKDYFVLAGVLALFWAAHALVCRSAYRHWILPGYRCRNYGFRLCCSAGLREGGAER